MGGDADSLQQLPSLGTARTTSRKRGFQGATSATLLPVGQPGQSEYSERKGGTRASIGRLCGGKLGVVQQQETTPVVITGLGVVSPIGVGRTAFAQALDQQQSGIAPIDHFDASQLPVRLCARVRDFEPKRYVRPRKSLKIMSRDMAFAVAAAWEAWESAGLDRKPLEPHRIGVVFGADVMCTPLEECARAYPQCLENGEFSLSTWGRRMAEVWPPLTMLKTLPNMVSCHVSIPLDARGPNNTIHLSEVSSLLALAEAARVIQRGWADAMLSGGSCWMQDPFEWVVRSRLEELSPNGPEQPAPRPFDKTRNGQVRGEGAGAVVLESLRSAQQRNAPVLARLLGFGSSGPGRAESDQARQASLQRAIGAALKMAGISPEDVVCVFAQGQGTRLDVAEAQALAASVPGVPVIGLQGYVGNCSAAAGVLQLVGALVSHAEGFLPATLFFQQADPQCPVPVVAQRRPWSESGPVLICNLTSSGQSAAVLVAFPD